MTVSDVMTRTVQLVAPATSLREAARTMRDADSGFLPVGENDRLVGTITDRDIVVRAVAEGLDPNVIRVRDVISEALVYCFEDDDEGYAAALMGEKQVRRLPVLNRDKRLVGVVSLGDLASVAGSEAGEALSEIAQDKDTGRSL